MNKAELASALALNLEIEKGVVSSVVDATFDLITAHLQAGGEVSIVGFGTFSTRLRHSRNGVDIQNPTQIVSIPMVRIPRFKAGETLKKAVRNYD